MSGLSEEQWVVLEEMEPAGAKGNASWLKCSLRFMLSGLSEEAECPGDSHNENRGPKIDLPVSRDVYVRRGASKLLKT